MEENQNKGRAPTLVWIGIITLENELELRGKFEQVHTYDPAIPQPHEQVWGAGKLVVKSMLTVEVFYRLWSSSQCPLELSQVYQQSAKETAS